MSENNSILEGKRILYAEDEMTNATLMMKILTAKGIKVDFANDGNGAMKMFANSEVGHYDAVIMDIHMPVINGHEAALAIRRMGRPDSELPIIAVTAFSGSEEKELSNLTGISMHINKPVDPDKLYSALEEMLK